MATVPDSVSSGRPAFHDGERALHEACGIDGKMAQVGRRAIRPTIRPDDAQFIVRRPFLALGARDRDGRPWATLVAGTPGWIAVPDPTRLAIRTLPRVDDPAAAGIAADAPVALLAIDFETADRCRVNGHAISADAGGFDLAIAEAFGNCPKYIRQRRLTETDAPVAAAETAPAIRTDPPDAGARRLIETADTFVIATAHAEYGCDVSHRGGPAGFVAFDSDDAFVFPDYRGNFFFNTLGNLMIDSRAGICFFGPGSGDLLQLTGRMQIAWRPPDDAPAGAQRMMRFIVEGWSLRPNVLPLRFEDGAPSPYLPTA